MLTTGPLPALPKGLPPSPPPMTLQVLIALKQWNKTAGQLATHPDDLLIAEGYGTQGGHQVVVYAASCTTKLREQAKHDQQIAAAAADAAQPPEAKP